LPGRLAEAVPGGHPRAGGLGPSDLVNEQRRDGGDDSDASMHAGDAPGASTLPCARYDLGTTPSVLFAEDLDRRGWVPCHERNRRDRCVPGYGLGWSRGLRRASNHGDPRRPIDPRRRSRRCFQLVYGDSRRSRSASAKDWRSGVRTPFRRCIERAGCPSRGSSGSLRCTNRYSGRAVPHAPLG